MTLPGERDDGGFDLDRSFALPAYSTVCSFCARLNRFGMDRTCRAFPKGIPDEIWLGKIDHTSPYSGDNGMTFLRRSDAPEKK